MIVSLQIQMKALVPQAAHVFVASHRDPFFVTVAVHIVSGTVSVKILALRSLECQPW